MARPVHCFVSHMSSRESQLLSLSNVKALLFDVDGTLYRHSPVRRRILALLAHEYCLRPAAGWRVIRALQAYRRAQEKMRQLSSLGTIAEEQHRLASQSSNLEPEFVRAVVERWMECEPLPLLRANIRPGLGQFLSAAREGGLQLAVCSDYPARRKLEAMGLTGMFDLVVCAQDPEIQRFKPDARMLLATLERLGTRPADAIFLGDREDVDGAAAMAAGVHFIRIGGSTGYIELLAAWSRKVPAASGAGNSF
jgi:FMN phosphatase YigB (HAD superfamily)